MTSSVRGRYSFRLRSPAQPPRTAGDHPDFPLAAFSQRVANTSERAPNRDRSKASFCPIDAVESIAVVVAGCVNSAGDHARRCPPSRRVSNPSRPRRRMFSERSASISVSASARRVAA